MRPYSPSLWSHTTRNVVLPSQRVCLLRHNVHQQRAHSQCYQRQSQPVTPNIEHHLRTMTSTSIGASSRGLSRKYLPRLANDAIIGFNPYTYTSGRWLRHDEQERSARHIPFDFEALSRRVVDLSPGASSIRDCIKKEGGFNRVFLFTTDNGQRLVAKLPFTIAGPQKLTTQSEVATMHYSMSRDDFEAEG